MIMIKAINIPHQAYSPSTAKGTQRIAEDIDPRIINTRSLEDIVRIEGKFKFKNPRRNI